MNIKKYYVFIYYKNTYIQKKEYPHYLLYIRDTLLYITENYIFLYNLPKNFHLTTSLYFILLELQDTYLCSRIAVDQ